MSKSIKLNNNIYWSSGSVHLDKSATIDGDTLSDATPNLQFSQTTSSYTPLSTTYATLATITFPYEFPSIPTVLITPVWTVSADYRMGYSQYVVQDVTTTGFTLAAASTSEGASYRKAYKINWVALCKNTL